MRARNALSLAVLTASVSLSSGASSQTWTNFQVGGLTRKALVYVPSGTNRPPLLISLHGMGIGASWNQGGMMKFEPIADREKFIVVYPEADQNLRWDLGGTHDIDFMLAIIDEMSTRHGIDRDRVYASGFSMGGMFSYTLACKIPEKIAAIAPGNGYPLGGEFGCTKTRPVPIFHMHGTADDFVKYSGIHAFLKTRISEYGCPATPVTTKPYPSAKADSQSFKEYWGPCINGQGQRSEVTLISVTGMIHDWATAGKANANEDPQFAGKPFDINGSEEAWAFLKSHSLTGSSAGGQSGGGGTASGGAGSGGTQSGGAGGTPGSTGGSAAGGGPGGGGTGGAIAGGGGGLVGSGGEGSGGTAQQGSGAFPGAAGAPVGGGGAADSTEADDGSGCACKLGPSSTSPRGLAGLVLGLSVLLWRTRGAGGKRPGDPRP